MRNGTDIVEAIFGVRELKEGTIKLNGKIVKNHTALEAINHGFAFSNWRNVVQQGFIQT